MKAVLTILLLSAASMLAQAPDGVVTGTVHGADARGPVEDAEVILAGENRMASITDGVGGFRFEGVAPGSYTVLVVKAGYGSPRPTRVEVRAGKATDPVDIALHPLAKIQGRVLNEEGAPVAGAVVEATMVLQVNNVPSLHSAPTTEDGRFLLQHIGPSNYVIHILIPEALRAEGYPAIEYYPGVTDIAQAAPIPVSDGAHMEGFDLKLRRVPLVKFRGRVVDLQKDAVARVVEVALDCEPGPIQNTYARFPVDAAGRFHFDDIPPGRHKLLAYRGKGSDDLPYTTTVEVGQDEVLVPVPPFTNLEGAVKSTGTSPWSGVIGIGLGADGAWRRNVVPDEEGRFTLADVPPGNWTLRVQSNNLGVDGRKLRIASARFGVADALNKPLAVTEGGNPPITVTLTDEIGRIAGVVEGDRTKEERDLVVAEPLGGGTPGQDNYELARADGSFLFSELLPGEYRVLVFLLTESRQGVVSPDCFKHAPTVTVANGQTATVRVKTCEQ